MMSLRDIPPIRQVSKVREPVDIVIPCKSKIKKWAFENAYTLIFLSLMFFVTWVVMIVLVVANA